MNNLATINLLDILLGCSEESFVLLDFDLVIRNFNSKANQLYWLYFKKSLSEGQHFLSVVRSENENELAYLFKKVLSGETVHHNSFFNLNGNDEVVIKNVSKPVKDSRGNVVGLIILATDITETENAKKLLLHREQRFRALVNEGADVTGIIDDKANYTYVTPGCENILGFTPEDFAGKNAFDFIHQDDKRGVLYSFSKLSTEKRVNIKPFRFLHKNGTWRWLETVATNMLTYPEVEGIIVNSRDITARKKVEQTILDREEELSLIYNTVSDIIFMLAVEDNDQYKFVTVNEAFYRTTGLNKIDVIDKFVTDVIPTNSLNIALLKYNQAIESGEFVSWEETSHFPAGEKTGIITIKGVCDDNKKCVLLVGSIHDITQERQIQKQIRLLESVVKNTSDVVMITSAHPVQEPGPFIEFVNEAFTAMTGYLPSEVIGKTPRILQGKNTDKKELHKLSNCLRSFESCEIEVINYKKNGEEFWNRISIFPIGSNKESYTHFVAFEKDVTERKKQEIEKEQLINELSKSNQELKQFSYITSHNLRGPLTNLVAISSFIDTKNIKDQFTVTLIEGFKSSTFKLNQTLDDLVNILIIKETSQQTEELYFQVVYNTVLKSIFELIRTSGIQIITDFSKVEMINFNQIYMESIFLNLITNAIKYSYPGGKPSLHIYTQQTNNKTQLIFEDNGLGFNLEKVKDRLFGLYQRFHSHAEGHGLGLYLVNSQVKAAGGNIAVESTENVGSKFIISFKS